MRKSIYISLLFFIWSAVSIGQPDSVVRKAVKVNMDINKLMPVIEADLSREDTLFLMYLPVYTVYDWMVRPDRKTRRLIRNVRKVYPYARLAAIKIDEYAKELEGVDSKREKKRIMKRAEKKLEEQFGDDLRKFTFSQGKILIKLIDRETGDTSFELVQELRGKFTAFFWQSFARIFGMNLKKSYDPDGEDKLIEQIVQSIERGEI
ncbi:MAG: DUF4294 domain-containing protein [Bacteroidota bacterium]|nr:DUF4294 domain-containing protein [Bacteroidota bacterium]